MPITDIDLDQPRPAPVVDGVLMCWRCESAAGPDDGYCSSCGAVTVPTDDPTRSPAATTSSTSAIALRPLAAQLDLEPAPSFNALGLGIAAGLGREV